MGCEKPPLLQLDTARRELARAAEAGAKLHSKAKFVEAEKLLAEAQIAIAGQKGRLAPFRDYELADSLLAWSLKHSRLAATEATTKIRDFETTIFVERGQLHTELSKWRDTLHGSLIKNQATSHLNEAQLAYITSGNLYKIGEYEATISAIARGRSAIRRLADSMVRYDQDEAGKLNVWRQWVQETIEESRAHSGHAIIVDKSKHKAYVVRAGKLVHSFDCELGYNPSRQKLRSGDGATPEGRYRVAAVNNGSRYYRALLLDYPNANDRARWAKNRAAGVISKGANIGGMIEIHGKGGRGTDWTEGCVAVTNRDMDSIMRYAGKGTPVTIVRRSDYWP